MNIGTVWKNIKLCEGQVFKTIRGVEYNYVVYSDYILINNDMKRRITKESLKIAITIDNPTPSKIQHENIWGASYVYGIITDNRIKN